MYTISPLISNMQLSLDAKGDLTFAPDIQTQMPVTLTAYHCIYDYTIDSGLLPYLRSIPSGGFNVDTITTIVTAAYQTLISQGVITDLQIAVIPVSTSYVTINITAQDASGNTVTLNWDNTQ